MLRFGLILLVLISSPIVSVAQKRSSGTIITKSGDTLAVHILNAIRHTNSEKVSYSKYVSSDEIMSFSPAEVKTFFSAGGYFQSISVTPGDFAFMKRLSYGAPAVLFSRIDEKGYPAFYILKDSVLTPLSQDGLVDQLKKTLTGCTELTISNGRYDQYFLKNLVSRYNACVNPEKVVYTKKKRPVIGSSGFKAGLNYNSIDYGKASFTSVGFSSGFFLDIPVSQYLSFQLELNYMKRGGSNDEAQVKASYIQLPVLLKVDVPINRAGTLGVYMQGGLSFNYGVGVNVSNQTYGAESYPFRPLKTALGTVLSVGVSKEFKFRKAFYLEARYDDIKQKTQLGNISGYSADISTVQLAAGVNF